MPAMSLSFIANDYTPSRESSPRHALPSSRAPPPSRAPTSLPFLSLPSMSRSSTPGIGGGRTVAKGADTPPSPRRSASSSGAAVPIFSLPAASRSATSLVAKRSSASTNAATRSRAVSLGNAGASPALAWLNGSLPPVPPPKGPVPIPVPNPDKRASARERYDTFEACMEGGIKYETQSAALGHSGDVAERHLNRAAGLFAAALSHQPDSSWAILRRATVLLHLGGNSHSTGAIAYLRDSRKLLTNLTSTAPNSTSARETLATVCTRLSAHLHALDDHADDLDEVWEGEVGRFACEALDALEDVATEHMDRVRALRRDAFESETPALADMFLTLAEAAETVASLARDPDTVDSHADLAEHALDQAANMATMAANAKVRPSAARAALITRVQLASGRAAAERMRHMFLLGVPLEEDDFAGLIADMTLLVKETRERACRLKGSKGAAAAFQAFEAVQQLGDTKLMYANLLRCVWRERRQLALSPAESSVFSSRRQSGSGPTTPGLVRDSFDQESSVGSMSSIISEATEPPAIAEEPEPEDEAAGCDREEVSVLAALATDPKSAGAKVLPTNTSKDTLRSTSLSTFPGMSPRSRRAPPPPPLNLGRVSNYPVPVTPLQTRPPPLSPLNPSATPETMFARRASDFGSRPRMNRASFSTGASPLGSSSLGSGYTLSNAVPLQSPARRRLSSLSRPMNAWERKPSYTFLSPAPSPGLWDENHVPTAELAVMAYNLLSAVLKHYKAALTLLSQAAEVGPERARIKAEVLTRIASTSLFRAMVAPRVRLTGLADGGDVDSPKQLLNTAEVYSTWAAREVGWSFIIEGTSGAELADRRCGVWEADEAGRRAVLLTLRIWWYRATADVGADKSVAKENVARVVRRLRELEGVGAAEVARFVADVIRREGSLDPVEHLFWTSVKRMVRGGDEEEAL